MGRNQQADGVWQRSDKPTVIKTKRSRRRAESKNGQEVKNWQTGKRTDRTHTGKHGWEAMTGTRHNRQSGRRQVKVDWYVYRGANKGVGSKCGGEFGESGDRI